MKLIFRKRESSYFGEKGTGLFFLQYEVNNTLFGCEKII